MAAEAYSARGAVVPSRNAAFESLMVAVNQMVPSGCLKDILLESMVTVNPFCRVRNRTDRRLFLKSGICKTRVNPNVLGALPSIMGLTCRVDSLVVS